MIDRFYLEEYLSFKKVELNFQNGLIIFSGPRVRGAEVSFDTWAGTGSERGVKFWGTSAGAAGGLTCGLTGGGAG